MKFNEGADGMLNANKRINALKLFFLIMISSNVHSGTNSVITRNTGAWPQGILRYSVTQSIKDNPYRYRLIQQAANEINQKTNVYLREYRHEDLDTKPPFLQILDNPDDGCHSIRVGYGNNIIGDNIYHNKLNLGSGCWSHGTIIHEFGHALGLQHEHKHPQRDQYLKLRFSNDQKQNASFFHNIVKVFQSNYVNALKPFDKNSIMLYSSSNIDIIETESGTKNLVANIDYDRPPTISAKTTDGFEIRNTTKISGETYHWITRKHHLSEGDIDAINTIHAHEIIRRTQNQINEILNAKAGLGTVTIRKNAPLSQNEIIHIESIAANSCPERGAIHNSSNDRFYCLCDHYRGHDYMPLIWTCSDRTQGRPWKLIGNYDKVIDKTKGNTATNVSWRNIVGKQCYYVASNTPGVYLHQKNKATNIDETDISCYCDKQHGIDNQYRYTCWHIPGGDLNKKARLK
jgi:meprin B